MLKLEIPDLQAESHRGRRRIRRLPAIFREEERSKHNYDPRVVSLGPLHHGKPHLQLGETFKRKALKRFLSAIGEEKSFVSDKIMAEIDEIRGCYDDPESSDAYDDAALAEMMLLDGCFAVGIIELHSNSESLVDVLHSIGMVGFSFAARDMFLLENQIPFRVISLLINLRYDARKGEDLLNYFLNYAAFRGHFTEPQTDVAREEPPLHLLEAIRRKVVHKLPTKPQPKLPNFVKNNEGVYLRTRIYTSRSVTDLKAKGIDFEPSPSSCLRDVRFISSGIFYGKLKLPTRCISENSKVLFVNLVAYETCPDNEYDYAVSSYVNLMKSLIHCARDVKELREKRVLVSNLGSDDEVFRVLQEIDTFGAENAGIFHDVKERIEEHYNSKAKTWMAELVHNYFESPWTAIALLAAVLLLALTFLQTYFTILPSHL